MSKSVEQSSARLPEGHDLTVLGAQNNVGILLTNLGTPDAPTPKAVRRYLNQFLSDKRVVELPSWLWQPILKLLVLPIRGRQSAGLYQSIWKDDSPLRAITFQQAKALRTRLTAEGTDDPLRLSITVAMRYGQPSIAEAIAQLKQQRVNKLLVLPLYPQYSATTTGSTFDEVSRVLRQQRWVPAVHFIQQYADHPGYIAALVDSIRQHWHSKQFNPPAASETTASGYKLIFSFHGLPQANLEKGDPYHCYCHKTARLVATGLGLPAEAWEVVFQSRFGKQQWLQPYCLERLQALPDEGVRHVDVVCPGFAADCLETLEEIAVTNKAEFTAHGGAHFHYIPALNAADAHITFLAQLIEPYLTAFCAHNTAAS